MYAFQPDFEAQLHETENAAGARLEELQQTLLEEIKARKIKGVDVDFDLLRGSPSDAISAVAHHYKPGLIVMGTKGRHRFARGFFGSTTARAIAGGKIPVMAVPPEYDPATFKGAKKLLYVTSFDATDFNRMNRLLAFVRPFKAKIYCMHVHLKGSMAVDEELMKRIREKFDEAYSGFDVECGLLQSEDLLEGLESFIQTRQIDVLAITARKQSLIEQVFQPDISRQILFRTHIPLLVFGG